MYILTFFTSSKANLAADVFPTPGGPYSIICCGYGDAILDKRDFIGLSCPIISEKEAGLNKC